MVVVQAYADLLEIVGAGHPPRGFARRLDGRQQERDEDADDGDHDQQFDQGEPGPGAAECAARPRNRRFHEAFSLCCTGCGRHEAMAA